MILISTHAEQDFADMIAASPAVGFLCKTALSPGAIRDLLGGRDDERDGPAAMPLTVSPPICSSH